MKQRVPQPGEAAITQDRVLAAAGSCLDRPGIAAAYLFGSLARGSTSPLSDADFAFFADDEILEHTLFDEIYECLQRHLGEGNFSLVPLRTAPLHIQFQVATDARILHRRRPAVAEAFEAGAIARYLDFKPHRDRYFAEGASRGR